MMLSSSRFNSWGEFQAARQFLNLATSNTLSHRREIIEMAVTQLDG